MRGVRSGAAGVGEGHYDLHAADEVHVRQHGDDRDGQQTAKGCIGRLLSSVPVSTLTRTASSRHRCDGSPTTETKICIADLGDYSNCIKKIISIHK